MKLQCLTSLIVIAVLTVPALGQSRQVPGKGVSTPVLLINTTVHPVTSPPLTNGWIAFEDGQITLMGSGDPPTIDGAQVIDLDGHHVYPGMIAADSILGLVETGQVEVTHDHDEFGSFTPESRAVVALNPDSDLIPVTRYAGVLTALVTPDGGRMPGQAAIIRLDGWDWEDMAVEPMAGMVIEWPRIDRSGGWGRGGRENEGAGQQIVELDDYLTEAEAYLAACDADDTLPPDSRYEAMRSMLSGEAPTIIKASTAGQIATAVAWAKHRGLDPIILGGEEADEVAELLVREDVPVIVRGVHRYPAARHRNPSEPHELPARLRDLGVTFCIAPRDRPAHLRNLPHHAATAVANGLTPEEGLRSITIDPAIILGIDDRLGSLEPGKSATLLVTTGDPLQIQTAVQRAWINGRPVDLTTRQTELRDKYWQKYQDM